jgi:hypothetical protein
MPIAHIQDTPARSSLRVGWIRHRSWIVLFIGMLLAALTLALGYANKARCTGPEYDSQGRSTPDWELRSDVDVCYSDIQSLWLGREIDNHVFPYVDGWYDPLDKKIMGGSLEYPVLTGLVIWASAIPAHTDAEFLAWSAIPLALCGLLIAFLLLWLGGIRGGWWVITPPVVLYAFHNWDLLVVAAVVAAFAFVLRAPGSAHPTRRLLIGALLLGVGAGLKLYPLMFVVPLALWVALGDRSSVTPGRFARWLGARGPSGPLPRRRFTSVLRPDDTDPATRWSRWGTAALVAAIPVTFFVLVNVPFMIISWQGWWASFQFQWSRPIDLSTNSIWFWGARPDGNSDNDALQAHLGVLSTYSTAIGLLLAVAGGWWQYLRRGVYPWLQVCAAMLAAYLLLNKVHSPQYVLWLLPFFVLLRIRAGWIIAYLVADAAVGIGFFKWQAQLLLGEPSGVYDSLWMQAVMIGVWGRAALLIGLFFAFLGSSVAPRTRALPSPERSARRAAARATARAAAPAAPAVPPAPTTAATAATSAADEADSGEPDADREREPASAS